MDNSRPDRELSGHVHPAGATRQGLGAIAWTSGICPCPSIGRTATVRLHWPVRTRAVRSRTGSCAAGRSAQVGRGLSRKALVDRGGGPYGRPAPSTQR